MSRRVANFIFALTVYLGASNAFAQSAPHNNEHTKSIIEDGILDKIHAALTQTLGEVYYRAEVKVVQKKKVSENLRSIITRETIKELSRDGLGRLVQTIDATIYLPKDFRKKERDELKKLLLGLLPGKNLTTVKIKFSNTINLKSINAASKNLDVLKTNQELQQIKMKTDQLQRERDDAKRALALKENEIDNLAREVKQLKEPKIDNKLALPDLMKRDFGTVVVGFSLFAALLLLGLAIYLSLAKINSGLRYLSQAMSKSSEQRTSETSEINIQHPPPVASKTTADNNQPPSAGVLSPQSAYDRIGVLQEEIRALLKQPMAQSIAFNHVIECAQQPNSTEKIVILFELMEKELARETFTKLSEEDQRSIAKFFKSGGFTKAKIDIMLTAAEEFKTRLLLETSLNVPTNTNQEISEEIAKIGSDEMLNLLLTVREMVIPRLLFHLEPAKIGGLLGKLRLRDEGRFKKCIEALINVPSTAKNNEIDGEVINEMKSFTVKMDADVKKPYIKYYQEILQNADERTSEQILEGLNVDRALALTLRKAVQTYRTLFLLEEQQITDLLAPLTVRELSALVAGSAADEVAVLQACVTQSKWGLVQDEVGRFSEMSQKQRDKVAQPVRSRIKAKLMALHEAGELNYKGDEAAQNGKAVA